VGTKLGLYGGGFKPFTTGHFAKLADAIRDNDKVYLFYGMQQLAPTRYGKKGQPLKSGQKFRGIGDSGRTYDEQVAQNIFNIYKGALERIPEVEVFLIQSQAKNELGELAAIRAPVTAIFKTLEDFVDDPGDIEKVTIYGDAESMRPYMRSPKFRDHVGRGEIQFGGAVPASSDDYTERLEDLMAQGEVEAQEALRAFYLKQGEDLDDEEVISRQTVRGTRVRDLASSQKTAEEAKKYLPPFLSNEEKDRIIQILSGFEETSQPSRQDEAYLRAFVRGIIRG
jgi:nicotinamide mononucleotide adenylyltransferase